MIGMFMVGAGSGVLMLSAFSRLEDWWRSESIQAIAGEWKDACRKVLAINKVVILGMISIALITTVASILAIVIATQMAELVVFFSEWYADL